jgi:hypothetical protein
MSFAGTRALLHVGGTMHLNKVAVYKWVQNSGEWLKWLCENICRYNGFVVEKPVWPGQSDVYLVDASEVVTRGNQKKYIMLHYCLDVFTLGMQEFHSTGVDRGEKLSNFSCCGEDDLVVGDRAYGRLPGIQYLRERGSGYVVRLRGKAFKV